MVFMSDDTIFEPAYAERPFTDFGQFGEDHLDLRVFEQNEWWVDRRGVGHRLVEMSEEYRRNVISHLLMFCPSYHAGMAMKEAIESYCALLEDEQPWAAAARELGIPMLFEVEAQTWLESTPLMRRLRALTPDRSN